MTFYKRDQIKELTGCPDTTLDRWSQELRATHMVQKPRGGRVLFTGDFLHFIQGRVGHQGPSNLPESARIAALYRAYAQTNGEVQQIAQILGENILVTRTQLSVLRLLKEI
jgi:hypothetical protein